MGFGRPTRMRHRPLPRRPDILRVTPQRASLIIIPARRPRLAALGEHVGWNIEVDRPRLGVDPDEIAILDQRDRSALGRFRPDMADAKASRRARETPIGDERDLLAHPLAV